MAAQKCKESCWQKVSVFLNVFYPKTNLTKALKSLEFSRPYETLFENSRTWGFRELFAWKWFQKLLYSKSSEKKIQILNAWKSTRVEQVLSKKFKNWQKGRTNWILQFFELYISHWRTYRFWRPGNQLKTWNLDLIFLSHVFWIWTQYNIKIVLGTY